MQKSELEASTIPLNMNIKSILVTEAINPLERGPIRLPNIVKLDAIPITPPFLTSGMHLLINENKDGITPPIHNPSNALIGINSHTPVETTCRAYPAPAPNNAQTRFFLIGRLSLSFPQNDDEMTWNKPTTPKIEPVIVAIYSVLVIFLSINSAKRGCIIEIAAAEIINKNTEFLNLELLKTNL